MNNFNDISLDDFNLDSRFSGEDEKFINVDGGTSWPCTIIYGLPTITGIGDTNTSSANFTEYNC
ncbi:hypothetical protein CSC2_32020 [Clostridium zeae]|uniref:Uncharacterized protein n=1 Tax=Clostridium zeae TaxID=2759022 RepID=A0ABQ1EDE5_9CLOT|nr:hypothetical protein [Clostridium zeae]GFZ32676.1 hypothetical protein CSC2_32020 [Clostridium zeae]